MSARIVDIFRDVRVFDIIVFLLVFFIIWQIICKIDDEIKEKKEKNNKGH